MLKLLGKIYGVGADLRNRLYERGVFASHDLGARTISIGNITTGGTGKTPLVAVVAGILADSGEKVCILTRGYGRKDPRRRVLVSDGENVLVDAATGGDEPVELAGKLIGKAIVIADADRVAASVWARERFGITTFVLDDGFQHRRAKRDLDILCIDATDPCGGSRVLPAGSLREPFKHVTRADAFVLTRSDLVKSTDEIVDRLKQRKPTAPIFLCEFTIGDVRDIRHVAARASETVALSDTPVFAFCGLGNPSSYFSQLRHEGFALAGEKAFPDHHRYRLSDIRAIESAARAAGAEAIVTTAKDAVKLDPDEFSMKCFVTEVEVRIDDPDRFRDLVLSA